MDDNEPPEVRIASDGSVPSDGAEFAKETRPAFYAACPGPLRDWWTLLHPPYTAWHLSYVVVGASLAPHVHVVRLVATVLAFFLAVGLSAHALDELNGRPLRTEIPKWSLAIAAVTGILGALALGALGVTQVGWVLVPFLVLGPALVVGYCLELFGGILHNDAMFALAWGAFPVLTAYVAQAESISSAAAIAALGACFLSAAQRSLSTPARLLRRRTSVVEGTLALANGESIPLNRHVLLLPLERALSSSAWAIVLIATAFALARLA
jgi:hypothetical protein